MPPETRRLLLATRSEDKAREIREILPARIGAALLTLRDIGLEPSSDEDDIETHPTFLANALAKADFFLRATGLPTLADDSGICVDTLGGRPGVRSRRFATGAAPETPQDVANNRALLERLADLPADRRAARYVCAAALARDGHGPVLALGSVRGRILDAARGHHGFGYDPLFLPHGSSLSFAEFAPAAKHRLSHRGIAFRAVAAELLRAAPAIAPLHRPLGG